MTYSVYVDPNHLMHPGVCLRCVGLVCLTYSGNVLCAVQIVYRCRQGLARRAHVPDSAKHHSSANAKTHRTVNICVGGSSLGGHCESAPDGEQACPIFHTD
jgi:hypothetical protein